MSRYDQPHQDHQRAGQASPYLDHAAQAGPQYGSPQGYYPGTPTDAVNPWAIASLVLGIAGTAVLAVVAGHIALSQLRRGNERGQGLAVAGLVLGYLGIVGWLVVLAGVIGLFAFSAGGT